MLKYVLVILIMFTPQLWAQESQYNVGVDGMACPFCVYGLEKQIKKIDGVSAVKTDLERGEIVVSVKKGNNLERDSIDKAVNNAGFNVRSFEQLTKETNTP
jgi:mercuric ion binding protein